VKTNGATPTETRHSMSAPSESEDPDFRVHAAWLAQVSEAVHGRVAKRLPQQGGSRPSVSPSSLDTADCLVGQQVRLAPPSRRGRRHYQGLTAWNGIVHGDRRRTAARLRLPATPGSCPPRICHTLGLLHRKILLVPLISLPSCSCLMPRSPIVRRYM
jgi:hypothetical protein